MKRVPKLKLYITSPRMKHIDYGELGVIVEKMLTKSSHVFNATGFHHFWCEYVDPTITNDNCSTIYWNEFFERTAGHKIRLNEEEIVYVDILHAIFKENIPEFNLEHGLRVFHSW